MTLLFLLLFLAELVELYQTCVGCAEDMKDEVAIYPIDSGISCAPQARAVNLAAIMAKSGEYSPEEIVETGSTSSGPYDSLLYR